MSQKDIFPSFCFTTHAQVRLNDLVLNDTVQHCPRDSKVYRFLVLDAVQNPHRILVMIKPGSRWSNAVPEQSLDLVRQWPGLLRRDHQILVLALPVETLGKEKSDIFSHFVSLKAASQLHVSKGIGRHLTE